MEPLINPDGDPADPFAGEESRFSLRKQWWHYLSLALTFWAPPPLLTLLGKHTPAVRQAWREKISLVIIFAILSGIVIFITMGLHPALCPNDANVFANVKTPSRMGILGKVYDSTNFRIPEELEPVAHMPGLDLTPYFDRSAVSYPSCRGHTGRYATVSTCIDTDNKKAKKCFLGKLNPREIGRTALKPTGQRLGFDWKDLGTTHREYFISVDGYVLNMAPYLAQFPDPLPGDRVDAAIRAETGPGSSTDATRVFARDQEAKDALPCLKERYLAGRVNYDSAGCFVAKLILYLSLIVILGVVVVRFLMAIWFFYVGSRRLVQRPSRSTVPMGNNKVDPLAHNMLPADATLTRRRKAAPWAKKQMRASRVVPPASDQNAGAGAAPPMQRATAAPPTRLTQAEIGNEPYVICLVTCYSEGRDGLATTLSSLSETTYPSNRKLIFVVADGMVKGAGENMSTPDIAVSLMEPDPRFGTPTPMSFRSVAAGKRAHNMALVYAGHYANSPPGNPVPMVVVAKCGTAAEAAERKPGNRGKRDSQMVLMNFLQRVTYNDPMTPLDYDLFRKIHALMGVTPDFFELCLTVDADTKVYPPSLQSLANAMMGDHMIMAACGETRISNKRQSWVTAIQVFEYFISHHQIKAFESVFGGVTCLPGCFSIYRIKARKSSDDDWVPIVVKPEIIREYSQCTVTTLHQKNLLLLGEDRFLTTILLRTFPHRKNVFVPAARCRTEVPKTFRTLLSQRRRWINSTVHNLMELVLVRDLCGTFCLSMQFVVFMDLIGTAVLPVAIALTYSVIIKSIIQPPKDFSGAIPLILLVCVLFMPGFLITLTQMRLSYVGWLIVYLIFLPVWNFILPLYSFWHFDDFSWGETRKVEGEAKQAQQHEADEEYNAITRVPMRRWDEWERARMRKQQRDERRRMEMERRFGGGFYNDVDKPRTHEVGLEPEEVRPAAANRFNDDQSTTVSMDEDDVDRWGDQIGGYDENQYTPPELLTVDPPTINANRFSSMLDREQLEGMLESGWEDEDRDSSIDIDSKSNLELPAQDGVPALQRQGSRIHTLLSPDSAGTSSDPLSAANSSNNLGASSAIGGGQTHARNRSHGSATRPDIMRPKSIFHR